MGRLIAIVLGGAALALFVPLLLPDQLSAVTDLWKDLLGDWYGRIVGPSGESGGPGAGAGVFAGLALVLLAVRGRD
jgi:hypothetical protein